MKKYIPFLFTLILIPTLFAYAIPPDPQATGQPGGPQATGNTQQINASIKNPFGDNGPTTLQALFTLLINNLLIPLGGVAAVLAFIYSGFLYVMAQGDETKLKTAHKALLYSAIGTAVLLGAAVISSVITSTINQLK